MRHWRFIFWAALVLAVSVAGCASAPPIRYFTLEAGTEASQSLGATFNVTRVQVPAYLDDDRIWVRPGPHRIEAMANVRWAERLPLAITRTLEQRLGTGITTSSGEPRLLVDIQRFEPVWRDGEASAHVVLQAAWQIGAQPPGKATLSATTDERTPAALVAAMGDLVDRLAQRIADSARKN